MREREKFEGLSVYWRINLKWFKNFPQKQKRVVLEERRKIIRIFIKRHSGYPK
jgi:hypothetical protein